jgi:hypothetical protein
MQNAFSVYRKYRYGTEYLDCEAGQVFCLMRPSPLPVSNGQGYFPAIFSPACPVGISALLAEIFCQWRQQYRVIQSAPVLPVWIRTILDVADPR